jgi:hypothetical protein
MIYCYRFRLNVSKYTFFLSCSSLSILHSQRDIIVMSSSWHSLPVDILNQILVLVHADDIPSQKNLAQCRIVCQSWNDPSRHFLFKTVHLDTNAIQFINAIQSLSSSGALVHKLYIGSQFSSHNGNFIENFALIARLCPNIHNIVIHPSCQLALLPCLLSESRHLTKVLSIQEHDWIGSNNQLNQFDRSDQLDFIVYGSTCFKQTLQYLYLTGISERDFSGQMYKFQYLVSQLENFPNLKSLYINAPNILTFSHFDSIVNACRNLHSLKVKSLDVASNGEEFPRFKESYCIRKLEIVNLRLNISAILYISSKFKLLENLNIHANSSSSLSRERDECWKSHLLPYLMTLKTYSITFCVPDYNQAKSYIIQMDHCQSIQKRKLEITILPEYIETCVTITRENEWDKFKLSIDWDSAFDFFNRSLADMFALLSPKEIHIVGLNNRGDYRNAGISTSEAHRLRFTQGDFYYDIYYSMSSSSWNLFDRIMLHCHQVSKVNVSLGGLVLSSESPQSEQSIEKLSTISNLTIEHSHLHVGILPAVSWRFRQLQTLKFNMCDFTGDKNRQRFTIHLPSTSIHTLIINVRSSYTSNDPYRHPELLKAFSRNSSFILKIETENNSYYSYLRRSEKLDLNNNLNLLTDSLLSGIEPFIVWIKCQNLEHLIISDGNGIVVNLFKDKF